MGNGMESISPYLADALKRASAELWIAVDDEHPDDNEDVLVWDGKTMYTAEYDSYSERWSGNMGVTGISADITHWMPLPAQPKSDSTYRYY